MQIRAFVILILAGITKYKYERKNEKDSVRGIKVTPSCKWSIEIVYTCKHVHTVNAITQRFKVQEVTLFELGTIPLFNVRKYFQF